mmetsp:Transcript_26429/g.61603  ORF Transcript_26429/g.61603 Transcript_26429/m.61603 type:complete len:125 (-) Transcript_26429:197-571(-)
MPFSLRQQRAEAHVGGRSIGIRHQRGEGGGLSEAGQGDRQPAQLLVQRGQVAQRQAEARSERPPPHARADLDQQREGAAEAALRPGELPMQLELHVGRVVAEARQGLGESGQAGIGEAEGFDPQ